MKIKVKENVYASKDIIKSEESDEGKGKHTYKAYNCKEIVSKTYDTQISKKRFTTQ